MKYLIVAVGVILFFAIGWELGRTELMNKLAHDRENWYWTGYKTGAATNTEDNCADRLVQLNLSWLKAYNELTAKEAP